MKTKDTDTSRRVPVGPLPDWDALTRATTPPSKESAAAASVHKWLDEVAKDEPGQWFIVPGGPMPRRETLARARQIRRVAKQVGLDVEVWTEIAQPNPRTTPGMAGKPQLHLIEVRIKPAPVVAATRAASEPQATPTPSAPPAPFAPTYEHQYEQGSL